MQPPSVRNLELLARFGAAAQQLQIDVGGVAQAMPLFGDEIDAPLVGLELGAKSMALSASAQIDRGFAVRIGRLAELLGADPSPFERLLAGREARVVRLELASTPRPAGLAATLRWHGDVSITDDATNTVLVGIGESVRAVLADRAAFLARDPLAGGASAAFALRVALDEVTEVGIATRISARELDLPDTMGRWLAIAKEMGIGDAQRTLFERIHPLLGAGGVAVVELSATDREMLPRMRMRWSGEPFGERGWEQALRVATGLYPAGDTAKRVGVFSGSFANATLASIEVDFDQTDPPAARIWAAPR